MRSIICFLVVLTFALTTTSSVAAKSKLKFAYIDLQKVIQSVEKGKSAKSSFEKEFLKKKKALEGKQKEIKKLTAEFERKSLVMNEDTRRKRRAELQNMMVEYHNLLQKSQVDMQTRERELMAPIIEEVREVLADLGKQRGYDLVLEKNESAVLYAPDGSNITDEVIEIFDKKKKKK